MKLDRYRRRMSGEMEVRNANTTIFPNGTPWDTDSTDQPIADPHHCEECGTSIPPAPGYVEEDYFQYAVCIARKDNMTPIPQSEARPPDSTETTAGPSQSTGPKGRQITMHFCRQKTALGALMGGVFPYDTVSKESI